MADPFRTGFVSLVGRPNVGKSTLMNRMLGHKVAIVSSKPQTTRNRIKGIHTLPGAQVIFLDTPGIHQGRGELSRRMVDAARRAARESDLVVMLIDAAKPWTDEDAAALDVIEPLEIPRLLVINKVDKIEKPRLLPIIEHSAGLGLFEEIIPLSALTGENVSRFTEVIIPRLPEGEAMFPDDIVTDQAERFWVAEVIREKVVRLTRDELPFSSAVLVEQFEESEAIIRIRAEVLVERESQKGIVIGKKGAMMKKIGESARRDIENFLGKKIFLELRAKVSKNWWRDREISERLRLDE